MHCTITTSTTTVSIFRLIYRQPVHKKTFFISCPSSTNWGTNWHPLRKVLQVLREWGLLLSTLSCWEKQQREPKVFSPIRTSENSHRPFLRWMHFDTFGYIHTSLVENSPLKTFEKRPVPNRRRRLLVCHIQTKPNTVLSIRQSGMSVERPKLCADTLPFDRWAVIHPSGSFSEEEEEEIHWRGLRSRWQQCTVHILPTPMVNYTHTSQQIPHHSSNESLFSCWAFGFWRDRNHTELQREHGQGFTSVASHTPPSKKKFKRKKNNNVHQWQSTSYESHMNFTTSFSAV